MTATVDFLKLVSIKQQVKLMSGTEPLFTAL
jgi:hypothetical protein